MARRDPGSSNQAGPRFLVSLMKVQILPREHIKRVRGLAILVLAVAHDRFGPAFDPAVEVCAAADVDAQAAVIVLTAVFPPGLRVVALQRGFPELLRSRAGDLEPEELG